VFCGAFQHGLWCASMLVSVAFGDDVAGMFGLRLMAAVVAGKQISKEEGSNPLAPSSTMLQYVLWLCGVVVVHAELLRPTSLFWFGAW